MTRFVTNRDKMTDQVALHDSKQSDIDLSLAWQTISRYLDVLTVVNLSEVNKLLQEVCHKDSLWLQFMLVDFPEHVASASGNYRWWYKDLHQFGAYYALQRVNISTHQVPTGIFLPLNDNEHIIATYRKKPVFQGKNRGVQTLRCAGECYLLWIGKAHKIDLTETEWSESVTTPNHKLEETHRKGSRRIILGIEVYNFFAHPGRRVVGVGRLSPLPHAKATRKAVAWLLDHFEVCNLSIQLPNYATPGFGLAGPFCISFSGWLKKGNILSPSEQKTPFTYDHNYTGSWCRHFDQEAQAYCEEPINMQYTWCSKHRLSYMVIMNASLDDQTDRDLEADDLALFYLRPGVITSHREGYPSDYAVMNGELIPSFDK